MILGAILCYDGLTGCFAAPFRAVTFTASLFFAFVGLGFFVFERNLSMVKQHVEQCYLGVREKLRKLDRVWRNIFVMLALAGGGYFLIVLTGVLAVLSRLRSGLHIFG